MIPLDNSIADHNIVLNADFGTDSLGRIGHGNDLAGAVAGLPEPGSIALLGFGAFLILSRRRRRA